METYIHPDICRILETIAGDKAMDWETATLKRIEVLLCCYDRAMTDDKAKLPSYLHAAIEALRK